MKNVNKDQDVQRVQRMRPQSYVSSERQVAEYMV